MRKGWRTNKSYLCEICGGTEFYKCRITKGSSENLLYRTCKKCVARRRKVIRNTIKLKMFEAYGNCCSCCGETEKSFLTLDHIDGSGAKHRKEGLTGWYLWEHLMKNGFPKDNYRLLCYNCNCSRGQYGECAHKKHLNVIFRAVA